MDMKSVILEETYAALKQDLKKEYKHAETPNSYIQTGLWKDKQIKNAMDGYAAGCRLQDAVVLCDTTIFSNGTKGFLFSTEGVYSNDFNFLRKKAPLALPIKYADLAEVRAEYNGQDLQLVFKDGRIESVYTGIYTGFMAESLKRILSRVQKESDLPKGQERPVRKTAKKEKPATPSNETAKKEKPAAPSNAAAKKEKPASPSNAAAKKEKPAADAVKPNTSLDRFFSPPDEIASKIRENIRKILIADDAAFSRMMLKDMLERAGFEICGEAVNGKEAVEKFKELMPGLTILDVDMPEMDGMEALEQIKAYVSFSHVIMLDASHSREVYERCARASANGILYKPVRQEELIKAVKDLLEPGWDWSINTD